jgi:hypothetical protein
MESIYRVVGGMDELQKFQDYLSDYKSSVYDGFSYDILVFTGNSVSNKKLYLLHDANTGHCYVITNINLTMDKRIFVMRATLFMKIRINVIKLLPLYSYTTLY